MRYLPRTRLLRRLARTWRSADLGRICWTSVGSVELDETAWRTGALLTIVGAVPPAFLGALHGIAVQGELDLTAGRAKDMCAYLARAISEIAQPSDQPECAAAVLLSNQAVEAAHMMLGEVLDWRILHQTHQVELM